MVDFYLLWTLVACYANAKNFRMNTEFEDAKLILFIDFVELHNRPITDEGLHGGLVGMPGL